MVTLMIAAAMVQSAPMDFRLDCEARQSFARRSDGAQSMPVTVVLGVAEGRIASVLMDGPPIFSSYRSYPGRVQISGPRELLPRNAQWRGTFQRRAIRLRRRTTEMVLEPRGGNYEGFWNHVETVDHRRIEVNGAIRCHTVGTPVAEGDLQ